MVKLYAIISKPDLAAVLNGKVKLSSILRDPWELGQETRELMESPQTPSNSETVTIEVSFAAQSDFSQYVHQAMDAPLSYLLPTTLIDTGLIRAFSDQEMLEVARETVKYPMLPSSEPLWHFIMKTPENERDRQFGPYLIKAYQELNLRSQ